MRRALLALGLLLVTAAPAQASSVSTDGVQVIVAETGEEANSVRIAITGDGRLEVHDGAGVTARGDCEAITLDTARCPLPPGGVEAMLNAGPNHLVVDPGAAVAVTVYGGPQRDELQGGAGDDRLYGGPGFDRLAGGAGDDLLRGHDGDDLLLGNAGEDTLLGEAGFDDLDGGTGRDEVDGGFERDRLRHADRTRGVRVSLLRGDGELPDTEDDVRSIEVVEGTPYADVVQGAGADEQIDGGEGDDRISGGLGADVLNGSAGDDLLLGDSGDLDSPSTSVGSAGAADTIHGGPGADALRGDAGRDQIHGEDGDDTIDAREAEPTQEVRQEVVGCGAGSDRALLDWNDEGAECEAVQTAARPGAGPPPLVVTGPLPRRGPGPQPVLGLPVVEGREVRVPVFCAGANDCGVRLGVRTVRPLRLGARRRSRPGRLLVARRARVAAGATRVVTLRLPAGARRGRVLVELRIRGERWARPLWLSGRALGS